MGLRRHYRPIVVTLAILAGAFTATQTGGRMAGDGLLYDLSLAVRASHQDEEPVVVVALDRRSLQAEELRDLPRALFARHWAQLVQALAEAEATAIGFDILFAWSAAALLPEDERAFLATLAANRDRVVLGRSAAWTPARPFFFAIGAGSDSNALGFLELAPDRDGIFRRVPTSLATDDGAFAGLAAAMAVKAGLPAMTAPQLLAPRRALSAIPTVSLIDVLRCAEQDPAGLKAVFRGRLVVVGSVLPDEDRKRTLDRFFPEPPGQGTSGPACGLGSGIVARQGGTLRSGSRRRRSAARGRLGQRAAQRRRRMAGPLVCRANGGLAGPPWTSTGTRVASGNRRVSQWTGHARRRAGDGTGNPETAGPPGRKPRRRDGQCRGTGTLDRPGRHPPALRAAAPGRSPAGRAVGAR